MGETVMPTYNLPQGAPSQGAIPTYPTQPVQSQGGGTGGLVDRNKIINDGVQNALNQSNQIMQMQRDRKAYNEKQAAAAGMANASNPAAQSATGDGHSDFMASVLQGLHSLGSGVSTIFGGGAPSGKPAGAIPTSDPNAGPNAGPPAPAAAAPAAATPPGMEAGGPVTDEHGNEIKKSSTGDLIMQGVKELGEHLFGSGGASRAGQASNDSVRGAQSKADAQVNGYQNGGPILAFEHGGTIPTSSVGDRVAFMQGPMVGMDDPKRPSVLSRANGGAIPASNSNVAPMMGRQMATPLMAPGGGTPTPSPSPAGNPMPPLGADGQHMQGATPAQQMPGPMPSQPQPAPTPGLTYAGVQQPTMHPNISGPRPDGMLPAASSGAARIPGFAEGGAIPADAPSPALAGQQGSQNALDQSQQITDQQRGSAQYTKDTNRRAATADASMPPQVAQAHLTAEISDLHQDMLDHSLNDDHIPSNAQAIPGGPQPTGAPAPNAPGPQSAANSPSPGASPPAPAAGAPPQGPTDPKTQADTAAVAQSVQQVATDPTAKTGVITTTPAQENKPHSITMDKWDDWDDRINNAVRLSALAGQDPGQVRAALEANRNAFVQGHVLRYLSAANVNLLNGNQKGVEQALRNAYYYMPDGQDLTIQKGKDGSLMYQDPVNPTTKMEDGKIVPNMIPVDASHLQLLGQAMLDPQSVNRTIMEVRSAQAVQQLKAAQSKAAILTGEGNWMKGSGINKEGDARLGLVKSENYKNLAEGDAARARATWLTNKLATTVKNERLDPSLLKGAQDASQAFEQTAQGQLTTMPTEELDAKTGKMVPSMNPNAGKPTRDPTKIPADLKNASPEDIAGGKALAGQIFLGSGGRISPTEAARLAILAHTGKRDSKAGPDGKQAGFQVDPKTGDAHVWNKAMKKWEAFRLPLSSSTPDTAGNMPQPEELDDITKSMVADNGSSSSAIPAGPDRSQEPDMEPQKMEEDT